VAAGVWDGTSAFVWTTSGVRTHGSWRAGAVIDNRLPGGREDRPSASFSHSWNAAINVSSFIYSFFILLYSNNTGSNLGAPRGMRSRRASPGRRAWRHEGERSPGHGVTSGEALSGMCD